MRIIGLLCLVFSATVSAEFGALNYDKIFPDPVSSHKSGNLNYQQQSEFRGGNHLLNFNNISTVPNDRACNGIPCQSSGVFSDSLPLPTYQTANSNTNLVVQNDEYIPLASDYNSITVREDASAELSPTLAVTRIRQLLMEEDSELVLQPGVYYIENFYIRGKVALPQTGVVTILSRNVVLYEESKFNHTNDSPEKLILAVSGSVNLNQDAHLKGFIYASNNVQVGQDVRVYGAINAPNLNVGQNARIELKDKYVTNAKQVKTLDYFDNSPKLVGHWTFDTQDQSDDLVPEEVVTDLINANHAEKLSGFIQQNNAKFCEGGYFDGEGAHLNIANISDYNRETGSLVFWFKMEDLDHAHRVSHGDQYLFSKDSLMLDNGGHLTSWVSPDGALHVRYQTPTGHHFIHTDDELVQENEWFHYALTWDGTKLLLYFNGEQVGSIYSAGGDQRRNLEPMIFGANARISGDQSSEPSDLYDFIKGYIDDIRWYDNALTQEQVTTLKTMPSDCEPTTNDGLVAEYRFADESWGGPLSIKDSSGNGLHATPSGEMRLITPVNNMSCGTLDIPPNTDQNTPDFIDTTVDLESHVGPEGTISFWFKSNSGWQDERDRTLLDAVQITESSTKHVNNKYFYLSLKENGSLHFGFETNRDEDTRFTTNEAFDFPEFTWVHVALQWDYDDRAIKIFLNGEEKPVTMLASDARRRWNGIMPDYGFIAFGDNRTDYITASSSANGRFDDIRIYNYHQSREEILQDRDDTEPCAVLYGYQITHPDQALTCEGAEVHIKACKNQDCTELLDDIVQIQLSPTPNGDPAGQMYEFRREMSFNLFNPTAETKQISLTPLYHTMAETLVNTCTSPDCQVEFVDAGLQIYKGITAPAYDESIALDKQDNVRFAHTAGQPMSDIHIRAVRNNEGACEAAIAGPQDVALRYSCFANQDGTNSYGCAVPLANNLNNGNIQNTVINLDFNSEGIASLGQYTMSDAINVALNASTVVNGATLNSNGVEIAFNPAGIQLATDIASAPKAGETFDLDITAYGYNGIELPSYQYQSLVIDAYHVAPANPLSYGDFILGDALVASANPNVTLRSATSPGIRSSLTFTDGALTLEDITYTEAGVVEMVITDQRYHEDIVSNVLRFGPFVPAYFAVRETYQPEVVNASGVFTYVGQGFDFAVGLAPQVEVTAHNALNQVVTNYFGSDWTLRPDANTVMDTLSLVNNVSNGVVLTTSGTVTDPLLTNIDIADGRGLITLEALSLQTIKSATPVAPFAVNFDLTLGADFFTDANGVCYQSNYPAGCESFTISNITGAEQRYGRIRLVNAYGPENETLRLPLIAEYFTNTGWLLHTDDSATFINMSQLSGQIAVSLLPDSANDVLSTITGVSISGFLNAGQSSSTDLLFPAPNLPSGLNIQLNPNVGSPAWAQYLNIDWNGDGTINALDMPSGTVNFGIFRGNDRKINIREVMP